MEVVVVVVVVVAAAVEVAVVEVGQSIRARIKRASKLSLTQDICPSYGKELNLLITLY